MAKDEIPHLVYGAGYQTMGNPTGGTDANAGDPALLRTGSI